jgi:dihydrodipicolinate synthase/N-acetylneuraminate lyase
LNAINQKALLGVVPIIPTPFDADKAVDEEALRGMVEFAAAAGLAAICLPAYGSEFYNSRTKNASGA